MASLGKAFELDADGDLKLETADSGGKTFKIIQGGPEVSQALVIRLRTRRGEDPISPNTGLPIPDLMGIIRPALLKTVVRNELKKEGRVATVQRVDVEYQSDDERANRIVGVLSSVQLVDASIFNIFETVTT